MVPQPHGITVSQTPGVDDLYLAGTAAGAEARVDRTSVTQLTNGGGTVISSLAATFDPSFGPVRVVLPDATPLYRVQVSRTATRTFRPNNQPVFAQLGDAGGPALAADESAMYFQGNLAVGPLRMFRCEVDGTVNDGPCQLASHVSLVIDPAGGIAVNDEHVFFAAEDGDVHKLMRVPKTAL